MNGVKFFIIFFSVLILMLAFGCVGSKKVQKETPIGVQDWIPQTLAIFPFENNSVTEPEMFAPLSKGIAAMLITDLKQSGTRLKVIERSKIRSLLGEIALSQGGTVDEATAIEAGKMLGAQTISFGSFIVLGKKVRIDTRIVRTETSEVVMAQSIVGDSDAFLELVRTLAQNIAAAMNVTFQTPKTPSVSDIKAALLFSNGLDAWDQGNQSQAETLFKECIQIDPAYKQQVEYVKQSNHEKKGDQ